MEWDLDHDRLGFERGLGYLLAMWTWAKFFELLSLSFLLCKMG